jgi:hypothetical protein
MAELFGVKVPAINKHLKNIFASGELVEASAVSILETTAADGKTYQTRYYNLDAIIAVGYRVNGYQATQFRIWATKTLREFIIKGFVLDDERLKQGKQVFGKDYFDEPHCVCLPRPGRESSRARHPDEDDRLGDLPEQLPGAVELPHPVGQGQGDRSRGEVEGRGRIRDLSQTAGRRIHLGLRS